MSNFKTQEDMHEYIMSVYEYYDTFTPYELSNIRYGMQEFVADDFDNLNELPFKDFHKIIIDYVYSDYHDYSTNREYRKED